MIHRIRVIKRINNVTHVLFCINKRINTAKKFTVRVLLSEIRNLE